MSVAALPKPQRALGSARAAQALEAFFHGERFPRVLLARGKSRRGLASTLGFQRFRMCPRVPGQLPEDADVVRRRRGQVGIRVLRHGQRKSELFVLGGEGLVGFG